MEAYRQRAYKELEVTLKRHYTFQQYAIRDLECIIRYAKSAVVAAPEPNTTTLLSRYDADEYANILKRLDDVTDFLKYAYTRHLSDDTIMDKILV